ncbi:MAG: BMP family protein [Anaerolineales bacterium]
MLLSLFVVVSMLLTACGGDEATPTEAPTEETPEEPTLLVGMVTDIGGVDDRSFNQTSWRGVERAREELNVEGTVLESQQQTDYATNINQLLRQETDLIVTVGFLLADATEEFAQQNPETMFAIVDYDYGGQYLNVRGLSFATDEAGFLAGYLAAAATQTGIVATYGGIKIPTVTIFMVGFQSGVEYYNEQHDADVELLGWSTAEADGVFVGNFESTSDGRRVAEEFLSEGADVIMPVAGPVGLGSAQAVQEQGDAWIIGVDTDWTFSAPEYADIVLTSVVKWMDNAVYDTIALMLEPDFENFEGQAPYIGTLENDGVGIAPVTEGVVAEEVMGEVENIRQSIIDGEIDTGWDTYLGSSQ